MDTSASKVSSGGRPRVVVCGGGLAGLAAAKTLVDNNFEVELLEQRAILGGKVSAWRDDDGDWIETGLHVFFGAYEEIYALMKEIGIYDRILWKEHKLTYTLSGGERFSFRTTTLPSPLHLLPAVFENHYFSLGEKMTLGKSLFPMIFGSEKYFAEQDNYTYQEWHHRWGINERMLSKMFLPMTLSLKFMPPEEISAKVVLDVAGTFLREPHASKMGFLKGSPQEHLTGPLTDYVSKNGGTVRTGCNVRTLTLDENKNVTGVELISGERVTGDYCLTALPIHKLQRVLPAELKEIPFFGDLDRFEGVPVITVQLWFDRQVTFIDNILFCPDGVIPVYADFGNTTPGYFLDDKVEMTKRRSRMEFVVAPARDLMSLSDEEIVGRVWENVKSCFPNTAPKAKITKSAVVRVPRSVFATKPGVDRYRPTQKTPIPNLFLAGGYTQQRFYDSMEGAVSSGRRAARALVETHRAKALTAGA
jgi:15-cis-phytoene desaturase